MRQSMIHNMSAPPRSHITIAPHRGNASFVRLKLMGFCSQTKDWRAFVLQQTGMRTWVDLEEHIHSVSVDIPQIMVMSSYKTTAAMELNPVDAVFILSRVIGNLYLHRTDPILSYERLSKQFVIGDPRIIEQLRTQIIVHS